MYDARRGERLGENGCEWSELKRDIRDSREKCDCDCERVRESLTDRQTAINILEHYVNWDTRDNILLFYYSFNLNYWFMLV